MTTNRLSPQTKSRKRVSVILCQLVVLPAVKRTAYLFNEGVVKTTHGGERKLPTTQRGGDSGLEELTRCRRPERTPRPIGAIAIKSLDEDWK